METLLFLLLIGAGAGLVFHVGDRAVSALTGNQGYGSAYSKEQIAEFEERERQWKEEFEAANPDHPPISEEEHTDFAAWLDAQTKPAVRLLPDTSGTIHADGSRLGGPAALARGQVWPVSKNGVPMEFVAQLDFASMPPLEGFPSDGVLQFFLPQDDDQWGMDLDNPAQSDVAVIYRANDPNLPMVSTEYVDPQNSLSPFWDKGTGKEGIALKSEAIVDTIESNNWALDARLDGNLRRPGFDRWEEMIEARTDDKQLNHRTGGYPVFVQWDFRKPGALDDYDTVLLRLTSDDHLQWGDVGEANFMIRSADLAKRDFSKVIFWWDCF